MTTEENGSVEGTVIAVAMFQVFERFGGKLVPSGSKFPFDELYCCPAQRLKQQQ